MPDAPGLELIAQGIEEGRQGTVIETSHEHGRATLIVKPEGILHALRWLRETPEQGYRFLSSLHAADYLPATPRFAVHYELICRERSPAPVGSGFKHNSFIGDIDVFHLALLEADARHDLADAADIEGEAVAADLEGQHEHDG